VVAFSVTGSALAAGHRTFVGIWRAIDIFDGSVIRTTIAGPARGPFLITWTESFFSFCDGKPGLATGIGRLNQDNPYILEASIRLKCLRSRETVQWHQVWEYRPDYDVLASQSDYGVETVWTRLGRPLVSKMDLRVNYGHDWVESFYKAGHTVWLTVKDGEGNVKATAEVGTEPKDFWGGETGFQTQTEDWVPASPDIQPLDWVYAQVDNGQRAQVQIGDIGGTIDLVADSIDGTIAAPWLPDEVEVECHSWGAPLPEEILKYDMVLPNGEDLYSCSWSGEWDIRPGQDVGVGYTGSDGHWVANAFFVANPTFVAYLPYAIEGYDWPMGDEISLIINDVPYPTAAYSEQRPDFPEGKTRVLFDVGQYGITLQAYDHIVMTDGVVTKDVVITNLAVTDINLGARTVSGTYDPAYDLWVWLYGADGQVPATDPDAGTWVALFAELSPGAWGGATQWDADGDGTSIDFQAPLE
jgi:hypothetical protein